MPTTSLKALKLTLARQPHYNIASSAEFVGQGMKILLLVHFETITKPDRRSVGRWWISVENRWDVQGWHSTGFPRVRRYGEIHGLSIYGPIPLCKAQFTDAKGSVAAIYSAYR